MKTNRPLRFKYPSWLMLVGYALHLDYKKIKKHEHLGAGV